MEAPKDPLPVFTHNGRTLTLDFDLIAQYELSKRNIDIKVAGQSLAIANPQSIFSVVSFFAAMVAHNYVESGEPIPTPEQWAVWLHGRLADASAAVGKAIGQAFAKIPVPPQTTSAPVTAPEKTTEPIN